MVELVTVPTAIARTEITKSDRRPIHPHRVPGGVLFNPDPEVPVNRRAAQRGHQVVLFLTGLNVHQVEPHGFAGAFSRVDVRATRDDHVPRSPEVTTHYHQIEDVRK